MGFGFADAGLPWTEARLCPLHIRCTTGVTFARVDFEHRPGEVIHDYLVG